MHLYQSKRLHGKFIIKVHLRDIFILLKFWQHVGLAVSSLIALNDREKKTSLGAKEIWLILGPLINTECQSSCHGKTREAERERLLTFFGFQHKVWNIVT